MEGPDAAWLVVWPRRGEDGPGAAWLSAWPRRTEERKSATRGRGERRLSVSSGSVPEELESLRTNSLPPGLESEECEARSWRGGGVALSPPGCSRVMGPRVREREEEGAGVPLPARGEEGTEDETAAGGGRRTSSCSMCSARVASETPTWLIGVWVADPRGVGGEMAGGVPARTWRRVRSGLGWRRKVTRRSLGWDGPAVGEGGAAERDGPAVDEGGAAERDGPAVDEGGAAERDGPAVEEGGAAKRDGPAVGEGGAAERDGPAVEEGGAAEGDSPALAERRVAKREAA